MGSKEKIDVQEIHLWSEAPGIYAELLDNILDTYEKQNPKVRIRRRLFSSFAEYSQALEEAKLEELPHIVSAEPGGPLSNLVGKGMLCPLDDYLTQANWQDRFYPEVLRSLTQDGHVYAVALSTNNLQVFCNLDKMEQHGLVPPTSIDALIQCSSELKGTPCYPMAFGNIDKWCGVDLFMVLARQVDTDGHFFARPEDQRDWGEDIPRTAFEGIEQLVKNEVFHPGINKMSFHIDAVRLWKEQKTLMIYPGMNFLAGEVAGEFLGQAIWFPALKGYKQVLTGGVALSIACVDTDPSCREDVISLMRWLTDDFVFSEFYRNGLSPSGPIQNAKHVESGVLLADEVNNQQHLALDRRIYDSKLFNAIGDAVFNIIEGNLNPKDACRRVQAAANR